MKRPTEEEGQTAEDGGGTGGGRIATPQWE